ncbi:MAG: AMP-binding protein [Actinomycetota bacterium]|nr:AMP-binding protein [Actinomycetota bacterium]
MKSNLAQYLYDHLKSNRGKVVALSEYREKTASWQQVLEYSLKFGSFLRQQGINEGDKILLKGENSLEWVVVFIGCILQGVAVVPVDTPVREGFYPQDSGQGKSCLYFL